MPDASQPPDRPRGAAAGLPLYRRTLIATAAALAILAGAAGTAQASRLIVLDGARAVIRDDPFAPAPGTADLGRPPPGAVAATAARASAGGRRAVTRVLRSAYRKHRIGRARYASYRRTYARARAVRARLRGLRGAELGSVIATAERLALRRWLIPSRMPEVFLQLRRNTQYWAHGPIPGARAFVGFRGTELLFEYYPGSGIQLQPLATFKKANNLHGACVKHTGPCRPRALGRLLDEMNRLAVRRSPRFIAWEYMFPFGGGNPPWMSGMAQASGIQALARAAQLLRRPAYVRTARRALGAFSTAPPVGVRARGFAGGTHYLQYSFAPRYYIFNAFTQAEIGLYDFGQLTGDARAKRRFRAAAPELRREVPHSDIGDWSLYSYRGPESTPPYHELLREVMQSMCDRSLGAVYCDLAARYRADQTKPAVLRFQGPDTASADHSTALRFDVSKLSVVELKVYAGRRLAFHRLATFRRGGHAFGWTPRAPGDYTVRLACKELRTGRELRSRSSGSIAVE